LHNRVDLYTWIWIEIYLVVRLIRAVSQMSSALGPTKAVLYIEPFYGGSHQQLVELLAREFDGDIHSLPATKWHWRSRVSALHFAQTLPLYHDYR